jgi:hypothetical protein
MQEKLTLVVMTGNTNSDPDYYKHFQSKCVTQVTIRDGFPRYSNGEDHLSWVGKLTSYIFSPHISSIGI